MDIARPSSRSESTGLPVALAESARVRSASPLPHATLSTPESRMRLLQAPAAAISMPIEAQARMLLSAVARPGDVIGDTDAVVDYIMDLLVHTHVLSGLMADLMRDGTLDRDLRNILGALFGLHGVPFFGQSLELKQVEAALGHVEAWHVRRCAQGPQLLGLDALSEARCPISYKLWAELDFPVAIDVGGIACVFEAESILQWMQLSMQTPGRKGVAINPLDRSDLQISQLKAVRWAPGHKAGQ